MYVIHHIR